MLHTDRSSAGRMRRELVRLLTMVSPLIAVGLITFLRTPRGQRSKLWGIIGLRRLALRSWPPSVIAAAIIFVITYGVDLLGSIALNHSALQPTSRSTARSRFAVRGRNGDLRAACGRSRGRSDVTAGSLARGLVGEGEPREGVSMSRARWGR
jgi:hypothetical protein